MPGIIMRRVCVYLPQCSIPQMGKQRPRRANRWVRPLRHYTRTGVSLRCHWKEKDLPPGWPHFCGLAGAKGIALGLAQVRPPYCSDGACKMAPSSKDLPEVNQLLSEETRDLLRPAQGRHRCSNMRPLLLLDRADITSQSPLSLPGSSQGIRPPPPCAPRPCAGRLFAVLALQ